MSITEFATITAPVRSEQTAAITDAEAALPVLVRVMKDNTDESKHVRNILYSLWQAGSRASLSEITALEWETRKAMCAVVLAFGCERERFGFFWMDAIEEALTKAGLFDWFLGGGR